MTHRDCQRCKVAFCKVETLKSGSSLFRFQRQWKLRNLPKAAPKSKHNFLLQCASFQGEVSRQMSGTDFTFTAQTGWNLKLQRKVLSWCFWFENTTKKRFFVEIGDVNEKFSHFQNGLEPLGAGDFGSRKQPKTAILLKSEIDMRNFLTFKMSWSCLEPVILVREN